MASAHQRLERVLRLPWAGGLPSFSQPFEQRCFQLIRMFSSILHGKFSS
jgi:hypothetical protein